METVEVDPNGVTEDDITREDGGVNEEIIQGPAAEAVPQP